MSQIGGLLWLSGLDRWLSPLRYMELWTHKATRLSWGRSRRGSGCGPDLPYTLETLYDAFFDPWQGKQDGVIALREDGDKFTVAENLLTITLHTTLVTPPSFISPLV